VRRYFIILAMTIIIVVLQHTVAPQITILNISFDLVFVFVICFSLVRDEVESVVFALFCGILRDSFFPSVFGINTVLYLIVAYSLSQFQKRVYKDAVIIPMLSAFIFTFFKGLLYYGYFYVISIKFNLKNHLLNVIILESIYNSILSLGIYRLVKWMNRLKIMQHNWKF
jgi:rod shape-determining protein MreD